MRAIEIKNISKSYENVTALDDVSVSFEFGKIYGLLGRNGAGKSTLINIITSRIFEDKGEVLIDGVHAKENMALHGKIFCMSEKDLYDESMKIREHFVWASRFYDCFDLDNAFKLADKFGLDTSKKFTALSRGYQSVAKLIIALSLKVPYTFFDEPVLGLDANHRELFYKLLLKEFENGERTFIIATHLIEEIADIIEEIVLIDKGKIIVQKSVEELLGESYSVQGFKGEVDEYCKGKNVIGREELGELKIAYILGEKGDLSGGSLQLSALSLQKLFIRLTEKGEVLK